MLNLKTPDIDSKKLKQTIRIIVLTTIGAFIALLIFGHFFPAPLSIPKFVEPERASFGIDPLTLAGFKLWNSLNQETDTIDIDECNIAQRLGLYEWKFSIKDC